MVIITVAPRIGICYRLTTIDYRLSIDIYIDNYLYRYIVYTQYFELFLILSSYLAYRYNLSITLFNLVCVLGYSTHATFPVHSPCIENAHCECTHTQSPAPPNHIHIVRSLDHPYNYEYSHSYSYRIIRMYIIEYLQFPCDSLRKLALYLLRFCLERVAWAAAWVADIHTLTLTRTHTYIMQGACVCVCVVPSCLSACLRSAYTPSLTHDLTM